MNLPFNSNSLTVGLHITFLLVYGSESVPTEYTNLTSTTTQIPVNTTAVEVIPNTTTESPVVIERTGKALRDEPDIQVLNVTLNNATIPKDGKHNESILAKQVSEDSVPIQEISTASPLEKPEKLTTTSAPSSSTTPAVKNIKQEDTKVSPLVKTTSSPTADEDRKIRQAWGGTCNLAVWNTCSRIRSWGGEYLVPDKNDPEKQIVKKHKIDCVEKPEKTFCLRNGWTVARCHMLCMSQCNVEYRQNYDKLVLHEGECRNPILGRK